MNQANRESHGLSEERFNVENSFGEKKKPLRNRKSRSGVTPKGKLFDVKRGVHLGAVRFHFDFFFDGARFTVLNHQGVFSGWNP